MVRMNQEIAPCAGDMSAFVKISENIGKEKEKKLENDLDKREFLKLTRTFSSKFARYCFMREFLEGLNFLES